MNGLQSAARQATDVFASLNREAEKAATTIRPFLTFVDRSPGMFFLGSVYAVLWFKQEAAKALRSGGATDLRFDQLLSVASLCLIFVSWLYWFPGFWMTLSHRAGAFGKSSS